MSNKSAKKATSADPGKTTTAHHAKPKETEQPHTTPAVSKEAMGMAMIQQSSSTQGQALNTAERIAATAGKQATDAKVKQHELDNSSKMHKWLYSIMIGLAVVVILYFWMKSSCEKGKSSNSTGMCKLWDGVGDAAGAVGSTLQKAANILKAGFEPAVIALAAFGGLSAFTSLWKRFTGKTVWESYKGTTPEVEKALAEAKQEELEKEGLSKEKSSARAKEFALDAVVDRVKTIQESSGMDATAFQEAMKNVSIDAPIMEVANAARAYKNGAKDAFDGLPKPTEGKPSFAEYVRAV